jgi:hypothetical protein
MAMKTFIFTGALLLAATGVQAQGAGSTPISQPGQAYTTLGPAGAGSYVEAPPQTNPTRRTTGKVSPNAGAIGRRSPRY